VSRAFFEGTSLNQSRTALPILICWITLLFWPEKLQAHVPAPEILDHPARFELRSFAYFEDHHGELSVRDVSRAEFQPNFIPAADGTLAFGYTNSRYWVSFSVINQSREDEWYLLPGHPLLQTQVYRIEDDGSPVAEASLDERYAVSRFQLKPQSETRFLVQVTSKAALSLQFELLTKPLLEQRIDQETMFLSAIVGCYLAMLLYNLFLYLTLRDQNYLFYLLFAFVNCHFDLLTVNFPKGIWSWFGWSWWDIIGPYRPLAPLTTLVFARSFLQIKDKHPVLNRCIFAYNAGLGVLILSNFVVPPSRLMSWTDLYFLLGILFLLYLGFYRLKEGFKPALYYIAGTGTFLLGAAICLMQMMGWLPSHPLTINAIVVAHGLEMILMSLALGGRFKLIQEEKLRAEVTASMKGHLLRTISHDIFNPLTIVKGHTSRLLREQADSKPLTSILKAVGVIEDIMHFVQKTEYLNQGERFTLTAVSIQDVFTTLAFLFEEKAREKGIHLEFKLEPSDLMIQAEKTSITNEVLGNFLSNAIKFSAPGTTIRLEARPHDKETVIISVHDQGIGMSSDIMENLFDPSQNRSQKGTQGEPGIGYGMPLAKAFLDAYGARIEVESKSIRTQTEPTGTVFRIFIRMPPNDLGHDPSGTSSQR
jgi:signal transduction histidine kinase